jgi:GAF domain-containing protein
MNGIPVEPPPDDAAPTREERLAETFVVLADTLVADYDVVEVFDRLVHACTDLLAVSQAGLLLGDQRGDLHLVASSDEASRAVEVFQLHGPEGGPCVEAATTGRPVDVADFESDTRWPRLAGIALEAGFHSVHAVPLRLREETIGALGLFNVAGVELSAADRRLARALADVATIGVLQQRSQHRTSLLTEQLQAALNSRVVIEQAKGMLAEHGGVDMDAAFELLRRFARDRQRRLGSVADDLVARRLELGTLAPPRG